MKITTPEEWWTALEDNWEDLLDTASLYLDLSASATDTMMKDGVPFPDGLTILQDMLRCKKYRSGQERLRKYLFAVWDLAPDNPTIHQNPAWDVLCSLLSEDWVFQEGREDVGGTEQLHPEGC